MGVTLLRTDGNDLDVVNAARCSFGKRHEAFCHEKDARLIRYLAREGHWSPFAHVGLSLHVKAPIYVARQLAKHQVGAAWNEVSRRYVDAEPEVCTPVWRRRAVDKKQGSSDEPFSASEDWMAHHAYAVATRTALHAYADLIKAGVAPEQARMVLPQAVLTEWVWTGSLYFFARVCRERLAPDAQAETRQIAEQIAAIAAARFPVSWAALLSTVA